MLTRPTSDREEIDRPSSHGSLSLLCLYSSCRTAMPIRLAQVLPAAVHSYSGLRVVALRLSTELALRGHEVELWTLSQWPDEDTEGADRLRAQGVRIVDLSETARLLRLPLLRRRISDRAVQIVHLHGAFTPRNNLLASTLSRPYLVTPHGGYSAAVLARHRYRKEVFLRLLDRPLLRGATAVTVLTEAERRDVERLQAARRIRIIPNGSDPPHRSAVRTTFRAELGLEPAERLAVFVGRLDVYYKRLDALVDAIAQVRNWRLALIGPDWKLDRQALEARVERLRGQPRVFILPPRRGRNLHEAMAAADLFVLVSRSEGLSLALLDALNHGVPALVSQEVEETIGVAAARAGWLTSIKDLPATLRSLLALDPEEWRRRQEAAARLGARYRWAEAVTSYEQCYQEILSKASL